MSISIPQPFDTDITGAINATVSGSFGSVGPVSLSGIPDTFHIDITKIPKIQLGVDPLSISIEKIPKIQLGIDPLTLNLAIKEIPSVRAHLPADFSVGLSFLGTELFGMRLCGEAQIITEPYHPGPCEKCGSTPGLAQPDDFNPAAF